MHMKCSAKGCTVILLRDCDAAVVELLHPHLLRVHLKTEWISEISGLATGILLPCVFHSAGHKEEGKETEHAFFLTQDGEASRHLLKAWQLPVVLSHEADRRHHCQNLSACPKISAYREEGSMSLLLENEP